MKLSLFIPFRFAYYSLFLLALVPVTQSFELTFWEIVRLIVITAGIVWMLVRRVPLLVGMSESGSTYRLILVSLIYVFILHQFGRAGESEGGVFLLSGLLVGVAFVGVCFMGQHLSPFSQLDKIFLVGGSVAVLVSLSVQLILGSESGQGRFSRWEGTLYLLLIMGIYFVFSQFLRVQQAERDGVRLLTVVAVTFAIVSLVGICRTAVAFYYSGQVVQSFRAGEYDETRRHIASLIPIDSRLQAGFVSLRGVLNTLIDASEVLDKEGEAYVLIGDIAGQNRLWGVATGAYQRALKRNPESPAVHARLGNSLFEQGLRRQALDIYRKGVAGSAVGVEDHLALAVALARMGSWDEANRALDLAVALSNLKERNIEHFSLAGKVVVRRVDELLPSEFLPYLEKLTLFEAVKLLQRRGWKIFHPAMQIGSTGVFTPVEIVALSGGGWSTRREFLRINGKNVSAHQRGYNVAVIDPNTGQVEDTDRFDTWENIGEGYRLADYLKGVARGKIVAATINDEGSGAIHGHAKAALRKVGVNRFPGPWWSHAFIGVKGTAAGSAIQAFGEHAAAVIGVLGENIPGEIAGDRTRLEALLRESAAVAPAKIAVFIPKLDQGATITVVYR